MKSLLLLLVVAFSGCAHHKAKPQSSARIIMEGDPNPNIREDVQHAGEHVRETLRR